ncbi:MAG: T9SS type A sorting domain-containing protein [Bacteroidales bacterium]|nr:T9SS type A sorting domain-containing protein [Bacteroidales bacterium]
MKRVFLLLVLAAISGSITAQERYITRGAEEGELFMSVHWYCDYGFWGDTVYDAILHITENGKKVAINHSVESRPPDSGIADSLPMQIYHVIADATPGVLYNVDWCYDTEVYPYTRLWFSDDYGTSWELRDKQIGNNAYFVANVEGLIYRGGWEGVCKSDDYGTSFLKTEIGSAGSEPGLQDEEAFSCGSYEPYKGRLLHTYDFYKTYTQVSIDSQYVYAGPDVFRGGLPGEVYVTSRFPNNIYKVSFSADTGYNFRVVHLRESYRDFMSDRKAGDFYIVTQQAIATEQPWGWYLRICVDHYTDYGEILAGTYCHDLTRDGVVTAVDEMTAGNDHIMVYPNPTGGEVRVESGELRVERVEIFDLMGRKVLSQKAEGSISTLLNAQKQQALDISYLPSGIYFVRIIAETGNVTKKVIKQ